MKTISDKYFSLCNELRMYIIDFLSKNGNEIDFRHTIVPPSCYEYRFPDDEGTIESCDIAMVRLIDNEIGIYCRNEYELINLGIDNINDVPDSELESNDNFFVMSDEHTYPNFITLMNIYNEIQLMNSNN